MTELEPVDEPEYENGLRELVGSALLLLSGALMVAVGTITGGALVYGQYRGVVLFPSLWPVTAPLTAAGTTIALILGLMALIGIIGTVAWPVIGKRTEYFVAGLAGLAGVSMGFVAYFTGFSQELNLVGATLPITIPAIAALFTIAGPIAVLSARLLIPDKQPESVRQYYDTKVPDFPSETSRERNEPKHVSQRYRHRTPPVPESDSAANTGRSNKPQEPPSPSQPPRVSGGQSSESANPDAGNFEFHWMDDSGVTMDDVGGMNELKEELRKDVILPLTSGREQAEALDIPLPNLLLHGPPGTGKTFMAKALAGELGLPFAQLSGSDVQSKWINESASKINQLFAEAKLMAEKEGGAVVFLDELDSVLKSRDGRMGHDEDQKVVNEFLSKLQETDEHNIVFIGATNRIEALDEAGIRSGRIDKKIHIGKPDRVARRGIIRAQLSGRPHELSEEDIDALATRTEGAVAADLKSIIEDAARHCAFVRGESVLIWQDVKAVIADG